MCASPNTAIGDLESFTGFLRQAIESDLRMEPFLEDVVYDRGADQPPRRVHCCLAPAIRPERFGRLRDAPDADPQIGPNACRRAFSGR
jgi:hypothetical protein